MEMEMSKNRATLETVIVSVLIPLLLWICVWVIRFGAYGNVGILLFSYVGLCFVYYYVIISRHKHLGALFVFLTLVLSTLLQFMMFYAEVTWLLRDGPIFGSGEGHPNGDAILVLMVLFLQPFIYDIGCIFIWIVSKIVWLYSKDDDKDGNEDENK